MYVFFLPFSSWRSSLPYPPINKANNIKSSSRFLTLNFWLLQPQRFELVLCGWRMWPPFLFERWSDEQGSFMLSWFLAKFTLPSWVKFAVMTVAYYYFFGLSKSKGRNSLQWGFNHLRKFCITFSSSPLFRLLDCLAWKHTLTCQTRERERPERRWTGQKLPSPGGFTHSNGWSGVEKSFFHDVRQEGILGEISLFWY